MIIESHKTVIYDKYAQFIHFFIQQIFVNSYFMLGVILDNRNTEMNRSFHGAYILKEGK